MTDADDKCAISDLPLYDQLLHGIGRVTQVHVVLELRLRLLYQVLAGIRQGTIIDAQWGVRRLAEDCQELLPGSWLPDDAKDAGKQALSEAKAASHMRDRVVHDWWVQAMEPESGGQSFERRKPGKAAPTVEPTPGDLAGVNETVERLRSASIRIDALTFALVDTLGGSLPGPQVESVEQLLPSIRGEFTLLPDGSWRPDSATEEE